MKLIDADALIKFFKENSNGDYTEWFLENIEDAIKDAPTVQREGWVSVPIEPTEEMITVAAKHYETSEYSGLASTYKAMISAAPKE